MAFLNKSEMIHDTHNISPKIILNLTQNEWNVYEAHIPPHTRNKKVNFVIIEFLGKTSTSQNPMFFRNTSIKSES